MSPQKSSQLAADVAREQVWVDGEVKKIGAKTIQKLIRSAVAVRKNAYPPYSHYQVGAAILTLTGNVYASCNAEVVSWSESDHAEQSTVTKAISEGEVRRHGRVFIRAVAVVSASGSSPCGRCRQVIAEHADNAVIIAATPDGKIRYIVSLHMLLPLAFTPKDLGI